jgi:small subunit ribosomal protein S2
MPIPDVRTLIEAGVHFGHRSSRWHPKMAPYIFGKNKLIHIVDLKATLRGVIMARKLLTAVAAAGEDVLFVGTKRQARPIIQKMAQECQMPYVIERWLGGTLTNFRTIRSRLARMEELERMTADGTMDKLPKKLVSVLNREFRKLKKNLEGIRNMTRMPGVMVIIDPRKEHIAVQEAKKLNVPLVALLDTDCDPGVVDIAIPGNDDALRSIEVIVESLAEAVGQGRAARMGGGVQQLLPAAGAQAPVAAPVVAPVVAPVPPAEGV